MQDLLNYPEEAPRPLISFIVTTYNLPIEYITECLKSVMRLSLNKRERDRDMGALREKHSPRALRSLLWGLLSMLDDAGLEQNFRTDNIRKDDIYLELSKLI